MDRRIHTINRYLTEYSQGRFGRKLEVTGPPDDLNACLTGFNILGEELEARTISRDYFTNIVNSVSDMVFILSTQGAITYVNGRVGEQLQYAPEQLLDRDLDTLLEKGRASLSRPILAMLHRSRNPVTLDTVFQTSEARSIPVRVSASWLRDKKVGKIGIALTAKDITQQLQAEIRVLRAVIDTQEQERQRLARDLHDGLGQQISAIKFHISATAETCDDAGQKEILLRSNEALVGVLADMRAICFNLMPQTLKEFGLVKSIKELAKQLEQTGAIHLELKHNRHFPMLDKSLEIDLFRIIQEFTSNAIKHGKARNITITLANRAGQTVVDLKDDGRGFDVKKARNKGMGLQNSVSRIKSHGGEMHIDSHRGQGTLLHISLPFGKNSLKDA